MIRWIWWGFFVVTLGFWLSGCSNNPDRPLPSASTFCSKSSDCGRQQRCDKGTCIFVETLIDENDAGTPDGEPGVTDQNDGGADAVTDEPGKDCKSGVSRVCFDSSKGGCTKDKDGKWNCQGVCKTGLQFCTEDGKWSACTGQTAGTDEICDGKDNNCDGKTDEDCECIDGEYQLCGSDVGECKQGFRRCVKGKWSDCQGATKPDKEDDTKCDGKDNDCDGQVDEECACKLGDTQACGSDVGECKKGKQTCGIGGKWGPCQGEVLPVNEKCDGKDNDCDGKVDETWEELGKVCTLGVGGCKQPGKYVCSKDQTTAACDAQPGQPKEEVCNGKDDDCNGSIDENLTQECFDLNGRPMPGCEKQSNGSWLCKGACRVGQQVCKNGSWGKCEKVVEPTPEVCDGKDNNCDGKVDEIKCECQNGANRACGSSVGECKEGKQGCTDGKWGSCVGKVDGQSEVCDGKDNDCDGLTDESLSQDCKTACGKGTRICQNGTFGDCSARVPTTEFCGDKVDNDCDGKVDEDCCYPSSRYKELGIELSTSSLVATSKRSTRWVATVHGRVVVLWDNNSRRIEHVLTGHRDSISGVVFVDDDKSLLTASADNTVRLWNVTTGALEDSLTVPGAIQGMVTQPPTHKRIAGFINSLLGGEVRFLYAQSGKVTLSGTKYSRLFGFQSLAYSPDGKKFVATTTNDILVSENAAKPYEIKPPFGPSLFGVVFVSNDKVLVGYDKLLERGIQLWNVKSKKLEHTFKLKQRRVIHLAVKGDAKKLVSVHENREMRLWSLDVGKKTLKEVRAYKTNHAYGFSRPAITSDGKLFFSAHATFLNAYKTDKGTVDYPLNETPTGLLYSPKGTLLLTSHQNGVVRLFDAKAWKFKSLLQLGTLPIRAMAIHPDDSKLAVSTGEDVRVLELGTMKKIIDLKGLSGNHTQLAFNAKTKHLYSGTDKGELRVWDMTGTVVKDLTGHTGGIKTLAVSLDGKWLLSADSNKKILLWDTASWKSTTLVSGAFALQDAAFSPDNKYLALLEPSKNSNSLRIWDLGNGKWVAGLSPNLNSNAGSGDLNQVLYSSNGLWLIATRNETKTVYRSGANPKFYTSQSPNKSSFRIRWSPVQSELVLLHNNGRLDVYRCPTSP